MPGNEVKLSIIVPVYNVEKYIERCLMSLLAQSFDCYEIIVVNDGTKDSSMKYVYTLQQNNDNVLVVNRENGGLSAARNTGIHHARGEYLFFCDSDDAISTDCLPILYQEAKSKQLDMLLFDAILAYDEEPFVLQEQNFYDRGDVTDGILTGTEMLTELLRCGGYSASACLYLIRRELLFQNKIFFYEGIIHEDELFTPVALAVSQKVEHRNWTFYHRYIRPGSITTGTDCDKKMEGLAVVIKELSRFCDVIEDDGALESALKKIIIGHVRFFLGETAWIRTKNEKLNADIREIRGLAKRKNWKLGLKFEIYLCSIAVRKFLGWNRDTG